MVTGSKGLVSARSPRSAGSLSTGPAESGSFRVHRVSGVSEGSEAKRACVNVRVCEHMPVCQCMCVCEIVIMTKKTPVCSPDQSV